MREIETDYLVVGAGASGMAFTDALVARADVDVVLVDRRHRPGGHWLDAYPFVRLHQPSAYYGVDSRALGQDRIDTSGANAGFYERATAAEICDYFGRVLDEDLVPTGRVRFLGCTEHRGGDGDRHRLVSLLTGEETAVRVRRRFVDASYIESSIPSRHVPAFGVDEGVRLVPPNDLVDLGEPAGGFTVIGAGKTAMDTCNWLLDSGVDADRIRWIRPRDPWLFERAAMQPLELVGAYMEMQANWVEAAAHAVDGRDFAHRMEDAGTFVRIDPTVEPGAFRGATISGPEIEALRSIRDVVRSGRVLRLGTAAITTTDGPVATRAGEVHVDCTASGVRPTARRPVFEPGRITLQYVTIGITPWSGATTGVVEALAGDDEEKNRLCHVLVFTGDVDDVLRLAHDGMQGILARAAHREVAAWNNATRLNPAGAAPAHLDDPRVPAAFASLGAHTGAALANLARFAG